MEPNCRRFRKKIAPRILAFQLRRPKTRLLIEDRRSLGFANPVQARIGNQCFGRLFAEAASVGGAELHVGFEVIDFEISHQL